MSAPEQKTERWKAFISLDWYDGAIEFLFRFVAKTSEPLLAAGIVYSAADVLSKGHLGSTNATMDNLWAISQALAIESSGGVVLVYGLESMKAKDRVKAWMYLLLSALLALAGGIMLFMQLAGLENQQIDSPLMRGLFALRCVVSVGYIYLCRTKAISFRNLNKEQPAATAPSQPPTTPAPIQPPAPLDYQQLAHELAPLLQAVRTTIIEEVKASITGPEREDVRSLPERKEGQPQTMLLLDAGKKQGRVKRTEEPVLSVIEKLEAVYQELAQANPGQRISGRALAKVAHVDRQTCSAWLKAAHPENMAGVNSAASQSQMAATASHSGPEVTAIAPEPAATTTELQLAAKSSESQPLLEATASISQPETTATAASPQAATTIANQPQEEVTAITPAPQPEEETTIEPGRADTTSQLQPQATDIETAITRQPEPDITATKPQSETTTASHQEPEVTATDQELESEKTTTVPRPRQKSAATATRKAARPRQKATV